VAGPDSNRLVLAFCPADEGQAERAIKTLPAHSGRVRVFAADSERVRAPLARYAALRLEGETLVAVETQAGKVESVVNTLRLAGTPAIFAIRPDCAARGMAEIEWQEPPSLNRRAILARLRDYKLALDTARGDLMEAARLDHALTKAAEWILDNSYLIHTQLAEVRRHLPREFSTRVSAGDERGGIYGLARELAAQTDFAVNEDNIRSYLKELQAKRPLTIGELWAFPLFLRIALIEALASLATRVSESQQLREVAYLWANRLASSARTGSEPFARILHLLEAEPAARQPSFVTALAEQLQDEEIALGPAQHWIQERFESPLIEVIRNQHTKEAAQVVATANAFGSLRALGQIEFTKVFEEVSVVEAELRADPGGIYARSDFQTRDRCRRAVERISRRSGMEELSVARRATRLAAQSSDPGTGHVAYYLLAGGVERLEADTGARIAARTRILRSVAVHATPVYIAAISGLTACFTALSCVLAWEAGVHSYTIMAVLAALAVLPLSELSIQIVNALIISLLPPEPLAKMDYRNGIPAEHATLVVVPMMLTGRESVRAEIEKLEVRYLGNRNGNVFYSLFSDFTDAAAEVDAKDAELLGTAVDGINDLNARYPGGRFLLFHRPRTWSESEQSWIGRERKRGKIEDLNAFLCGDPAVKILHAGQLPMPIAYVITLDADTQLPLEAARRLIETIAHPLNRVEIDPATGVRKRGYTIIQPRISITLPAATATRFTRVFADATGTDPYCQTVSDAQQDLFLEAIFHGKAIYDVKAFHAILKDRFPAETVLSHDLIEGAHVGVGLASDIELFENLPTNYGSFATRQRRWIRGDWQIAPWALGRVPAASGGTGPNPLTLISRWRIVDNLRRSLVPVAALLLLLLGWLISAAPGVWSLVVGLAVAIPALAPLLDRLARQMQGSVRGWQGAADDLERTLVMLSFLPHQAWLAIDAIARVVYRRRISHRNLLEWQTAERARVLAHHHLDATFGQMLAISGLSAALALVLALKGALVPTSAFIGLWAVSPLVMRWLARPGQSIRQKLGLTETLFLHGAARRTWRFFDDLVGPESHWLPPDNSQLALQIEVAQRTSPTNIGLWLTAALAARDFGYLTADELCARCSRTMETVERLERYEGHLLNWYDTRTLTPLTPRYVSTVDSGNLVAALWVLKQGCHDAMHAPVIGHSAPRGLADTLSVLEEKCGDDPSVAVALQTLRKLLRGVREGHELAARLRMAAAPIGKLREGQRWHVAAGDERTYWASRLAEELTAWNETANRYLRWMETLASPPDASLRAIGPEAARLRRRALRHAPSLAALAAGAPTAMDAVLAWKKSAGLPPELAAWLEQLAAEYALARANAAETVGKFRTLCEAAEDLAEGINMRFLYDGQRRLFGVGYAVGGPREFTSHYDLLASECRLASLVAIAKGDAPAEHWYALSRPWVNSAHNQALLSWSGTMFEYLMPLLFTRTFANSLLDSACRDAIERQIEYGNRNDAPWGISESAYSALDAHRIYQYRAFGVPALALNPSLEDELVVAPYATILALPLAPAAATANLERLKSMGMVGPMGFYEAIDFTRESKRDGARGVVIYSCMAHHQAMSLAALDNLLHRDVMQRRFHDDPRIRAVESLLYERIPIQRFPMEEKQPRQTPARTLPDEEAVERVWTEETAAPRAHLYGNGRYALMITNSGGGYSRWNEFDLTRWRSDPTLDPWGSFLYVRDVRTNEVWAASNRPFSSHQGESAARLSADRAEFRRRVQGIETVMEVTTSAEDDAELRRLKIFNRSLRSRQIEFTSYLELAMAPHGADKAHPAFAKMFIETEYPEDGVLIARRRPRSPQETPVWMGHALVGAAGDIQYETDRAKFLGRGNTPENPVALRKALTASVGAVVDPIFSLRCRVSLDAREQWEIAFVTVAGASREAVMDLIHKYGRGESVSRAFEMAWTRAQLDLRFLGVGPGAAHRFQELASQLLYPNPRLRPPGDRLARNRLGQEALWAYSISGDLPILTVTISEAHHLPLVREALLAHSYWRLRGFRADLVILNQESPGYDQPLRQQIVRQVEAHASQTGMDRPGGVFVRDWHSIPEEGRNLIIAASSLVLSGGRGPLQQQLAASGEGPAMPPFIPAGSDHEEPSRPLPFLELPYFNGLGGFTSDGREYAIYLKPGTVTPSPWVNVMANGAFGTMVSESGLGFTWHGNSQANRLTPWHNDPVSDPQSETIYLRDDDSGAVWTPTALPAREKDAYRARHGQGYTVFEHNSHAIGQELTVFVPLNGNGEGDPVKVCRLRLRNDSSRRRRIAVHWFAEWVLGANREDQQLHLQAARDEDSGALLVQQYWHSNWAGQFAFAASSPRAVSWTGDRAQFLGRTGSAAKPAALGRARLDNRPGAGADPGAALQVAVNLERGEEAEVVFLLGQAGTIGDVRGIVERYQTPAQVEGALDGAKRWWETALGALHVHTPILSVDLLLNRWLLYQVLSCRYWGRSALYQSGGAFGFRDQLQDSMAFLYAAPQIAREHILASAARQFREGDVQHWWHADSGSGVRTRCSDDLLWLPWAVAQYIRVTGDAGILDEEVPFLEGPVLADGEQERMFVPQVSAQTAPLWEHCGWAIEKGWRPGPHGLPLMGNGDWNDGMNLVGAGGRGESVWLGWFLFTVLESFADTIENRRPGRELASAWRQRAVQIRTALENVAWDGDWYLRGFFDDGTPLGSHASQEARIDSLPQSWAVISGAGDAARARRAMESAEHLLVRERDRLVLLFEPPFDRSEPNPGYIMGYPPGMRENGGQYTHGATWMAMAWARLREGGRAAHLLQMMNPIELNRNPENVARYRGEPYVMAADVSAAEGRVGQSGWTWYTGSAGWMYRIWVEEVLGFRLRGDRFTVDPAIPEEWDGFELTYRHGSTVYEIVVRRQESAEIVIDVDGNPAPGGFVPLADAGGTRHVSVGIPKRPAESKKITENNLNAVLG
jgi:cyclic beta-1,2-glucan synthetase